MFTLLSFYVCFCVSLLRATKNSIIPCMCTHTWPIKLSLINFSKVFYTHYELTEYLKLFKMNGKVCVEVCSAPTFNLDSRGVGSSGLLPPAPPVLTEALGLWDEGAQRVFLEPVRVFEGEPLPILPLGEHQFHYIHFLTASESRGLRLEATAFLNSKDEGETGRTVSNTRGESRVSRLGEGRPLATKTQLRGLPLGPQHSYIIHTDNAVVSFK